MGEQRGKTARLSISNNRALMLLNLRNMFVYICTDTYYV